MQMATAIGGIGQQRRVGRLPTCRVDRSYLAIGTAGSSLNPHHQMDNIGCGNETYVCVE
jgi:hypothetical protein